MAAAVPVIFSATLKGAVSRFVLSAALSFVAQKIFAPDLPANDFGGNIGPDQGVKQRIGSDPNNKIPLVYGEARTYGSITFADISSDNQTMAFIVTLAEGPVQNIGDIYWDSYKLTFDGDINTGLRNVTDATDPDNKSDKFLVGNLKVRAYKGGENNACPEMVAFSNRWKHGTNTDGTINTNVNAVRNMPNLAYLYVELKYDQEDSVTGLSTKLGAVVTGRTVKQLTRTGQGTDSDPYVYGLAATESNSNNPADCLVDYLTNKVYGCGEIVESLDELDLETFYNHKVFCDEMIEFTKVDGTTATSKRYTTNGFINTNDNRDLIISDLCVNSQAVFGYKAGKFSMTSDTLFTTAEVGTEAYNIAFSLLPDFDDDNMYGDITIINDGFNTLLNKIVLTYNSKNQDYQDYQTYLNFPRQNNEPELVQDTRFKFVNNNVEAERAARVILFKSRDNLLVSFQTDNRALALQVNDVIKVTNSTYGWSQKLFRVNSISETQIDNNGISGFNITAQEYNRDAYIATDITEFEAAPNTSVPRGDVVGQVTGLRVVDTLTSANDRELTVEWSVPEGLVHGFQVFFGEANAAVADRLLVGTTSQNGDAYVQGNTVRLTVTQVQNYTDLYIWIRANNNLGFTGTFSLPIQYGEYIPDQDRTRLITIYKNTADELDNSDRPTENYNYNLFTDEGYFIDEDGDITSTSNGWAESTAGFTLSENIYSRQFKFSNIDRVAIPVAWSDIEQDHIGGGTTYTANFQIYRVSDDEPGTPAGTNYNFDTQELTLPLNWNEDFSYANLNKIWLSRGTATTNSLSSQTVTVTWSAPVLVSTVAFEATAYANFLRGEPGGAPISGSGSATATELTAAPTGSDGTQWTLDIEVNDDINYDVYRSRVIVVGSVIGTWGDPELFLLRGIAGPTGPTNLTRYAAFESDARAQIVGAPINVEGYTPPSQISDNQTNEFWVSSPDLLGVDEDGNTITYTHTTTQFGTLTGGGAATTQQFDFGDNPVIASPGSRYTKTISNSNTPGITDWTGQTNIQGSATVDSGITDLNYINRGSTEPGWQTGTFITGGVEGMRISYPTTGVAFTFGIPASITGYNRLQITFRYRNDSDQIITRYYYSDQLTTFQAADHDDLEDFINFLGNNNAQNGRRYTRYSNGIQTASDRVSLHIEPTNSRQIFVNMEDTTDPDFILENLISISFAAAQTTTDESADLTGGAAEIHDDWVYIASATSNPPHSGITFNWSRQEAGSFNVQNISYTVPWSLGTTLQTYLQFAASVMTSNPDALAAFPYIASSQQSGNDITLNFTNDGATYGLTVSASETQGQGQPSVPQLNDGGSTNPPEQTLVDVVPNFATFGTITDRSVFRFSDAYTNEVREYSYYGTETTTDDIFITIRDKINNEADNNNRRINHLLVHTYRTDDDGFAVDTDTGIEYLGFDYTATTTYDNGTIGFDGRAPNLFFNIGKDSDGNDLVENTDVVGLSITVFQQGTGGGTFSGTDNRITGIIRAPLANNNPYRSQYNDSEFRYELTFDSNPGYPSAYQQIANASKVIYEDDTFLDQVNNNNVVLTYFDHTVTTPPSTVNIDMYGDTTLTNNVNGWNNAAVNGNGNFTILRLSRYNDNIEVDEQLSIGQFKGENEFSPFNVDIDIFLNLTANQLMNLVIENAAAYGVYTSIIDNENNILQIQDSGIGRTRFNISVERPNSSTVIPVVEGTQFVGEAQRYAQNNTEGTPFAADRWTRPVNTGRQVE